MANQHKDLTGLTFGTMTVTRMTKVGKHYHAVCLCTCGAERVVAPTNLRRMQSCGCLPRARKPTLLSAMIGQRYGFLEVLSLQQAGKTEGGRRAGVYYAVCHCHLCGKAEHPVLPASLRRGASTSCGCRRDQYRANTGEHNANFRGYREIRSHFWNGYRRGAEARRIPFDLTMKYAWDLFEAQDRKCAFSGVPLTFGVSKRNSLTTASIDRIDPNKGYVEGNVQWVHKQVNIMRNTLSVADFIQWCRSVTEHADRVRNG